MFLRRRDGISKAWRHRRRERVDIIYCPESRGSTAGARIEQKWGLGALGTACYLSWIRDFDTPYTVYIIALETSMAAYLAFIHTDVV